MKFNRSSFFVLLLLVAASADLVSRGQSTQPPTFRTRVDAVTVAAEPSFLNAVGRTEMLRNGC